LLKTNASISVPIDKEVTAALINELPLDSTLDGWKNYAGPLSSQEEDTSP
jgi:hypothetical protein